MLHYLLYGHYILAKCHCAEANVSSLFCIHPVWLVFYCRNNVIKFMLMLTISVHRVVPKSFKQ